MEIWKTGALKSTSATIRSFQTLASHPLTFSSAAACQLLFSSALSLRPSTRPLSLLLRGSVPSRPLSLLLRIPRQSRPLSPLPRGYPPTGLLPLWVWDSPPTRAFSLVSPGQELELVPAEHEEYQAHLREVKQEKQSRYIPVKACFLCTSIDLKSLQSQNAFNVIPPNSRAVNYVVLRYLDIKADAEILEAGFGNESNCQYMVVFQYGSVVLFNVADHEADGYLKIVEKHASGLLPEMRKDDYAVVEKPNLELWMQAGLDHIMLKNLSIDGIRTIGSVLGQSIALDYYIRQVDGIAAEFTDINSGMEKTGTFTMKRKKLFQLVGKANSYLADVIFKLGLFERSDIAWKNAHYDQIWEYLRDEYELTQRLGSLDIKLKFVTHNIGFLQETLQNRRSDFLEWLVIILIGLETLISVYHEGRIYLS